MIKYSSPTIGIYFKYNRRDMLSISNNDPLSYFNIFILTRTMGMEGA